MYYVAICKLVRMRPNVVITGAQVIDDLFRQGKGAQVSHLSFMHSSSYLIIHCTSSLDLNTIQGLQYVKKNGSELGVLI